MNLKKITCLVLTSVVTIFSSSLSSWVMATSQAAVSEIQVLGLFKNAAVLKINDERKLVRVGEEHQAVHLLAANSNKAMVEVKGKRYVLSMADNVAVRVGLPDAINAQAHLISNGGMYKVTGSINQQLVDFVVDTGATYITMNAKHARKLGLDFSHGKKVMMNTAKGKTTAHVFTVASVRIGGIELRNVKAAVVHELESNTMLLGMSFLNQVEMRQKNGLMVLKKGS